MCQPSPWLVFCLLPLVAGAAPRNGAEPAPARPGLAIVHVTVIDSTGAPPRPDSTVVVAAGRIATVGPSARVRPPAGSRVIDGTGKFLIPGLWDMHVHLSEAERSLPLFVAEGVTGVRGPAGALYRERGAGEALRGSRRGCGPARELSAAAQARALKPVGSAVKPLQGYNRPVRAMGSCSPRVLFGIASLCTRSTPWQAGERDASDLGHTLPQSG